MPARARKGASSVSKASASRRSSGGSGARGDGGGGGGGGGARGKEKKSRRETHSEAQLEGKGGKPTSPRGAAESGLEDVAARHKKAKVDEHGAVAKRGEKHEAQEALCQGRCHCTARCPENEGLISVFEKIGELLEKHKANRFEVRQIENKDICRVRKFDHIITKEDVKEVAREKGLGEHVGCVPRGLPLRHELTQMHRTRGHAHTHDSVARRTVAHRCALHDGNTGSGHSVRSTFDALNIACMMKPQTVSVFADYVDHPSHIQMVEFLEAAGDAADDASVRRSFHPTLPSWV